MKYILYGITGTVLTSIVALKLNMYYGPNAAVIVLSIAMIIFLVIFHLKN